MNVLGACFLAALVLSLALTPLCRALAHRLGYVARPRADRWGRRPAALFGGLAIVAAVLPVAAASGVVRPLWPLLSAGVLIAVIGLADDVLALKASTKLIAQISVGSLLLFFGYRLHWTESAIGDAMLTLFWIVGITNAFNLLDNMDGLCSGVAIIAGACLLVGSTAHGIGPQELYLAILLGASAGFLVYNFHPASIFLGDTGSLFLGVNLATLTLVVKPQGAGRSGLLSAVAVPVLLLLIPIFDTTFVTAVRLLSRRKPSQGGRDHTSHRLVAIGLSEPRAVATLWFLAAGGGVVSLLVQQPDPSWPFVAALTLILAMVIFAVYLARIRTYAGDEFALLRRGTITPLVTNFMYKRRVAEVLLDLCLIPIAYYSAYRLRFEGPQFPVNYPQFIESLPFVLACQQIAFFAVGSYRGSWRHFGMMDAVVTAKGIVAGTVCVELVLLYLFRFDSYSRAVFIIYAAILMILHTGSRASFRLISEFVRRRRDTGERLLVYGAGEAGAVVVRELMGDPRNHYRMLGFIDDDEAKRGSRVQGYRVLHTYRGLVVLIENGAVDRIVISTRAIPVNRVRELQQLCASRGVALSRLSLQLDHLVAVGEYSVNF
jgi:UDP-GlcNAc:undecaprenyl-phosphate/decaprenyl-phosphate GlcNAc-1-phosphate transferase